MIKLIFILLSVSYLYHANGFMIQGTQKTVTDVKHNFWTFGELSYIHSRIQSTWVYR